MTYMPIDPLSPRQLTILKLYDEGLVVKEIAAELNLSPATISVQIGRIASKLGARSSAQILKIAYIEGIIK